MDVSKIGGLFIALALSMVISFPLVIMLSKRGFGKSKGERIVESAKRNGRVACGRLISQRHARRFELHKKYAGHAGYWIVDYEYMVGRRTYHYITRLADGGDVPQELMLYYPAGKPEKAISEYMEIYDARDVGFVWLPAIIWVVIYFLFFN